MTRTLLALCLVALAPAARGQWDSIPYVAANPVLAGGFVVVHDNGAGVNAFSAMSRKWTPIAPPGATIVGVGDWCVLTSDAAVFTAYSARLNASATLPIFAPVFVDVDDDVALVIDFLAGLGHRAHAYSAQTNTWASTDFGLTLTAADIAVSRFVIGIKDGTTVKGFAARTAFWSTTITSTPPTAILADGNVVVADANPEMHAFSGVLGSWATSPPVHPVDNLMVDHNVAYVRALAGLDFNACGYSAYNGAWVTSTVVQFFGTTTELITDNVARVESTDPLKRFEAFGARPGAAWALLTGTHVPLALDEDYAVVALNVRELHAFSGVCGGTWELEITCGPSVPLGSPDHVGVFEEGPLHHTFRPSENVWEPPVLLIGGPPVTVADATWDTRDGTFQASSTRWPGLNVGPAVPPETFATTVGGSFIAHQQVTGAGAGDVYVFDERCDQWPAPFDPGANAVLAADRNALVAHFGTGTPGPVWGYSVQRGDWTSPAAATPLTIAPTVEENVAWLVDGAGDLWGFGTPNRGHVWFQWPNGTEVHVSGGNAPYLGYSVVGAPGDVVFVWVSLFKAPGLVIWPVLGLFCLDPTFFFNLGPLGSIDLDCLFEVSFPLSVTIPPCLQVWFQPLLLNPVTTALEWGERCEPAWFF